MDINITTPWLVTGPNIVCGIFGIYSFLVTHSRHEIVDCLLNGLQRLEYRGYDSAGLAVDGPHGDDVQSSGEPIVIKAQGKVADLRKQAQFVLGDDQEGTEMPVAIQSGIAHTRWATHGPPSTINAHPQSSDQHHEFLVVHNGIITNFSALKSFLVQKGEEFQSETDTEVIAKLCRYVYASLSGNLEFPQLIMDVMTHLEGSYALLIKSTHYPNELMACKKGSPLILGVRNFESIPGTPTITEPNPSPRKEQRAELYLSSDASAIIEHTKRVLVLEDNDVCHLKDGAYSVYNASDPQIMNDYLKCMKVPELIELELEVEQIMKGGYEHYMQKEIFEQPDTITQTMRGRIIFDELPIDEHHIKLGGLVDHLDQIKSCRRIVIIGCGTSYNAGLAARSALESLARMPVSQELASDLLDRRSPIFRDDACIFLSQSGETADTLRCLEFARNKGALCIGITNTVGSAIARLTHCGVHINAGAEIGVASTKAYTSQIVVLLLLAIALSEDSIPSYHERKQVVHGLSQLAQAVRQALTLESEIVALAADLADKHSLLLLGRGSNYATAVEGALKVKEVSLMHSEGIAAGELKHGPLALVDDSMPLLVIATKDSLYSKMLSVIEQLKARGGKLIVIGCEDDDRLLEAAGAHAKILSVPCLPEYVQPVVNIIPLQLLAYHLAVMKGYNVDQPRNLAKSVTVSEEA